VTDRARLIVGQVPKSPVPLQVSTELERVVERWRQLPLDRAQSYAGRVKKLVQALADGVATASGVAQSPVPDCGPATLMDQLTVMVYDATTAAAASREAAPSSAADRAAGAATLRLGQDLARLRRELL